MKCLYEVLKKELDCDNLQIFEHFVFKSGNSLSGWICSWYIKFSMINLSKASVSEVLIVFKLWNCNGLSVIFI